MLFAFRRRSEARPPRRQARERRQRFHAERLESRLLLAVNVTNLNDSGSGSLRAAIEAVNSAGVADTIVFSNLSAGTIYAQSTFPTLAVSGTTFQFSNTKAITLDGTLAGSGGDGLIIGSGVNEIGLSGIVLAIQNFAKNGLSFAGGSTNTAISGVTLRLNGLNGIQLAGGDYTGTTIRNTAISDNAKAGIVTAAAATGLTIGGSVAGQGNNIYGNGTNGIELAAGSYTGGSIAGNRIVDNEQNGIATAGGVSGLTIGGTSGFSANSIVINSANGILLQAGSYDGTKIIGNSIVLNDAAGISLAPAGGSLTNLAFGGTATGTSNAVSSNKESGVEVLPGTYTGTTIAGNQITSNTGPGISLAPDGAGTIASLTIGGTSTGAGNSITANGGIGLLVAPSTYTSTLIAGNTISANKSHGVSLAAAGGTIAGLTIGVPANQISGNNGDGINVTKGTYTSSLIQTNAITANTLAAIRLAPDGGTLSDLVIGGSTTANLGNTISDDSDGIIAEAGTYTTTFIRGNSINGAATGITLTGAQSLMVGGGTTDVGNTISSSTTRGIYASGTLTGTTIYKNTVSGSTTSGIELQDATGLTVGFTNFGNTITGGKQGIVARGALGDTTVASNVISGVSTGVLLEDARGASSTDPFIVGGNTKTAGTGLGNSVTATSIGLHGRGDLSNTIVTGNLFRATAAGANAAALVGVKNLLLGGFSAGDGNLMTAGRGNGLYASGTMTSTRVYRNNITASQYGVLLDNAKSMFVGFLNTPSTGNIIQYNQVGLYTVGNCAGTGVMNTTWFNNIRKVINGAAIAISPAP